MSSRVSSRTCTSAPPCTNGTCASQTTTVRIDINGAESPEIVSRRVAEIDHVAVLDDVFLAFQPELAVIAARGKRAARQQVLVADDFRADEAPLDVGVDLARVRLRRRPARNRPGPALVVADGEERDVPQQIVAGADHAVEARFAQP